MLRLALLLALAPALAASRCRDDVSPGAPAAGGDASRASSPRRATGERRAVVYYTGAVHGALEPCGCTSDPLGDVARLTGLVRAAIARDEAVGVVDAGNLLYPPPPVPERRRAAADLRARFLAAELGKLPLLGVGLGRADLVGGPIAVRPPRVAANLAVRDLVEPSRLARVGDIAVGVLGVVDPAVARGAGLRAEDPVAAATREAAALRARGAEVVVALAPVPRPLARQIARAAAVDFVILGDEIGDGLARADPEDGAFLLAPAIELQRVGRLEIVLRGAAPPGGAAGRAALVDAGGPEAARLERALLDKQIAERAADLARWRGDRHADPAFLADKIRELDELRARAARPDADWRPPARGSYFINRLIPLSRALPRDPTLAAAMRKLDEDVGRVNLARATPPPRAPPGRAAFVGDAACVKCHEPEMKFWSTTVHARAWTTLVDGGKTGDEECVSCHVTGFGEIGGSSLGFTDRLEAVQCETCHGPGSIHVLEEGLEEPPAVRLSTPESTCVYCHNEKHSDTFEYTAYLRDVLGPGHGEHARRALGAGPTGAELRAAAKAKAKAAGAAIAKEAQGR